MTFVFPFFLLQLKLLPSPILPLSLLFFFLFCRGAAIRVIMACILWCRNRSITSATTCISAQGAPAVLVGLLLLMNLFLSDMLTGQRKGEGRGVSLICPYSGLPHPFFPLSSAPCFFTKKNIEESLPQKKKSFCKARSTLSFSFFDVHHHHHLFSSCLAFQAGCCAFLFLSLCFTKLASRLSLVHPNAPITLLPYRFL